MKKIFAIMGATGHIGQTIIDDLLKRGHTIRAIGRDAKKLHQLEHKGAIPVNINFDDAVALTNAFKDAYAVFSFIPPGYGEIDYSAYQDGVSDTIIKAIENSQVKRVVNLSSMGAHLPEGTGPIKGLYRHERKLDSLKNLITLIHLRPDFFMDNLVAFLPSVQNEGVVRFCLKQNLAIPMVSTRDIGWKAADFLDSSAPLKNLVFEFVGPRDETMNHAVEVLGRVFDLPNVRYEEMTPEEERKQMLAAGMKPDFVDLMIEMYNAFNAGLIRPTKELKASHHGRTTLEEYLQMLSHKLFAAERK